jgi:predicted nucleic acid-binding protein
MTTEQLVVDTSAALAILRAEPQAAACRRTLAAAVDGGSVLVPDHFWLEVGNVLMRRYGWDPDAVVSAVHALDELGIETAPVDRPMILLGLDIMAAHRLSAYDAAYLALATIEDARLLTLDGDLAAAAGDRAIVPGRPDMREAKASYGSSATPRWSIHGRYLADLRRRASEPGAA